MPHFSARRILARLNAQQPASVVYGHGHGQLAGNDFQQQAACLAQAVVDVESTIQMRIVNQAFPAHGGARFFKIHAHHNQQFFGVFLAQGQQVPGVFDGGLRVVNRARADNHQQALIATMHQIGDFLTGIKHQLGHFIADGQLV